MYKYKVCEVSVKYRTEEESDKEIFAKNRDDVVDIFRQFMQEDIELEEMSYGLILNNRLKVIACINIGIGDTTNCVINTKKLLSACLLCNGNAVISHGHALGQGYLVTMDHFLFVKHAGTAVHYQLIGT